MTILKIVILQLLWFLVVLYGKEIPLVLIALISISVITFDYQVYRPQKTFLQYLKIAFIFTLFGFVSDTLLLNLDIISKSSYSYSFLSLWTIFTLYYEKIFEKFRKCSFRWLFFIAGIGGASAYIGALNLGAFEVDNDSILSLIIFNFLFWAIFFPLSIRLYDAKSIRSFLLDKLIVTSFDRSGFLRHQREYFKELAYSSHYTFGKKALITGGTSGIGESVLGALSEQGIAVNFIGRNEIKGKSLESGYNNSTFIKLDMSSWENIDVLKFDEDYYDYVVLNAGGMPEQKELNSFNVEFQCASQLIGHYKLINTLKEFKKIDSKTRIVWVSSGGMYLKKLDIKNLLDPDIYDKVDVYANVKRAQVTLIEELSKSSDWKDYNIFCMHPGWVKTTGLTQALPKFSSFLESRLRNSDQGADTIVWLLLTSSSLESGKFYFDRKVVSPYIGGGYIPSSEDRIRLMNIVENI
jgi:dehydrogenase/reductase SDR family protein 12